METLKYIMDHLEGLAGAVSVIFAFMVLKQSIRDRKEDNHEKRIQIYMDLFHQWDDLWTKITAFPENNKEFFGKKLTDIEDENKRLLICNTVSLLSRVFYYYQETKQDINKSEWISISKHVFKNRLFISAFVKHQKRYSVDFRTFVSINADIEKLATLNKELDSRYD